MLRGRVRRVRIDQQANLPSPGSPVGRHERRHPAGRISEAGHVRGSVDRLAVGRGGLVDPLPHPAPGPARVGDEALEGVAINGRLEDGCVRPADRVCEAGGRRIHVGAKLRRRQAVQFELHRLEAHRLPSRAVGDGGPRLVPDAHDGRPAERACRIILAAAHPEPPRVAVLVGGHMHAGDVVARGHRRGRFLGLDRDPVAQAPPHRALAPAAGRSRGWRTRRPRSRRRRSAGRPRPAPAARASRPAPRPPVVRMQPPRRASGAGGGRGPASRPQADRTPIAATPTCEEDDGQPRPAPGDRRSSPPRRTGAPRGHPGAHSPPCRGARGRWEEYRRGTGQPSRPMARYSRLDATGGGCHLSSRASTVDPCTLARLRTDGTGEDGSGWNAIARATWDGC